MHFLHKIRKFTINNYAYNFFKIFLVFNFVSLSWIFFRSPDLNVAFNMAAALFDFSFKNIEVIIKDNQFYLLLIIIFLILHKIDSIANFRLFFRQSSSLNFLLIIIGVWILVLSFGSSSSESFIYYDF